MKSILKLQWKQTYKSLSFIGIMTLTLLAFNPIYGQNNTVTTTQVTVNEKTIKGVVSDETTSLEGVNVIQYGTKNGTVTNEKGEFTFPKKLKTGDVLLFSYLGYVTQKVEIKDDTTFITLKLTEDLIEMSGALDSAKPYKSKRKN
ncbi:carboxypeptidase-like regulatory domain-containing protein [Winogradskyella thalassocola]|uniref:CarboxypepD_reg-like domain-containing protein n=1 Tax=Winogradskyella thalassocola TaxID=262004 RepID=A0A1G7YEM9_9FLAO|nr:carboxypeptidase-like regulatory domain-containing protein [Winogradskyella thalassocola]SDG94961.1 CarboxypepD_reg-like domain-containing protein [Winogradskyella thalassocola]